jgi:hypothetical protein
MEPQMSANPHELRIEARNLRDLRTRLTDLWAAHPDWVMAGQWTDTIYCLPASAIDVLAFRGPRFGPFLDARQAAIERAFTALCGEQGAVGTQAGAFITDTPLNARPALGVGGSLAGVLPPPDSQWGRAVRREMRLLDEQAGAAAERIRGFAGWLVTSPDFLDETCRLRVQWASLPAQLRPTFPFHRPGRPVQHANVPVLNPEVSGLPAQEFGETLARFLDRWGLRHLAAWDLPAPHGPLSPNRLPPNSPAQPRTGVHVYYPTYFPIPRTADVSADIRRSQHQAAHDQGVDESAVGLPHFEIYARILELVHLDRSIQSRFPGPKRPRGIVDRTKEAIAGTLGMTTDRVRKYRLAIKRCWRGDRSGVDRL